MNRQGVAVKINKETYELKSSFDLENMNEEEKLVFQIKLDSLKKIVFLKDMILDPSEELGDGDHKFIKEIAQLLIMRIDKGIENIAKEFMNFKSHLK